MTGLFTWRRMVLALLLLIALVIAAPFIVLNTAVGQRWAAGMVGGLSGGQVQVVGLSGRFPDALRVASVKLADARGVWLEADDVVLDWAPLRLLHRAAEIERLTAGRVAVARLPVAAETTQSSGSSGLPVSVDIGSLRVARLELGAAVAGHAAVLSVDGRLRLESLERGEGALEIARLDAPGSYKVSGRADAAGVKLDVVASEPAQGLAAALAGLPDLVPAGDALALDAKLDGPWSEAVLDAGLSAGPMKVAAKGTLDLVGQAADLEVSATAPAMRPRPDLSWGSIDIAGHVRGTLAAPVATAKLRIGRLAAFGVGLSALAADVVAKEGRLSVDAQADGLQAPGVGGLFAAAPLRLQADTTMDAKRIDFTLDHPRLHAHGTLVPAGTSEIALEVPEVTPFAALGGQDVRGGVSVQAKVVLAPEMAVDVTAKLALTGGVAPVPGLIGADGRLVVQASRSGADFVLSKLALDGAKLHVTAKGALTGGKIGLDWTLGLPDVAVLTPQVGGSLNAAGRVSGATDDLAATAKLDGTLAVAGQQSSPVHATLAASGLPGKPSGRIEADGALDGSPLSLLATAARDAAGTLHLDIAKADWKSLHVEGALTFAAGASLPQGRVAVAMGKLSDLDRLMGGRLAGSLSAEAVLDGDAVHLKLDGASLGAAGSGVTKVGLVATVSDPLGKRVTDATLRLDGLRAQGIGGSAKLEANGPPEALGLKLSADLSGVAGAPLAARAAAVLDAAGQHLDVSGLTADWRDQHLALARPLRVGFADGVTLDDLALRLGAASLSVKGRVAPALDVTVALRDLPASLAQLAAPSVKLAGTVSGDAKLVGPAARPNGTVRLRATRLRTTEGPAQTLKPADVTADATLAGGAAKLDVKVASGADRISLVGTAPIGAGALDLRAQGRIDVSALNAVLAADGRQVRGRLALDARITGSTAAPKIGGTARLSGGEVQDIPLGVRLRDISAEVSGDGEAIRLVRLSAKAGAGTIGASGRLSLAAPMPVDLKLTAKDAQLLASELIRGTISADLSLSGALAGAMQAAGTVTIGRTDIRVPDTLPAGVATLDVRKAGDRPRTQVAVATGPEIGLNVRVQAPAGIFVRGRGLDVELHGALRMLGTAADPRPQGRFTLRRGSFTLAGKRLAFDTGTLRFDGGLPIDPSLDFSASTSVGDVTATLAVTGYASKPKITLSSAPELPQDEILARLLFNKSAVSLGPVELAQIAGALAQMAGGSDFNPLDSVRSGLGLDRLSVSGGANGQSSGATLEAGRTIAPGVYLGAKQNATGSGTQATVEIDLGRGLKLQAGVGSGGADSATGAAGGGGNDVGITYQFDY
jgi:translocation and assembly module TamB